MPQGGTRTPGDGDEWLALAILAVASVGGAIWAGAQVSSMASAGHPVDVSLAEAMGAAIKLPGNFSHPAEAWPAEVRESIPGPLAYWSVTSLVLAGVVVLAAGIWLRAGAGRIGTQRRRRLGVEIGARLASRRDVSPLVVDGPTPGRFILGTVRRRLVATENRAAPTSSRLRGARAGDRSAVAVIGPTRSGKTATVVAGILDWDGPAILSSVQNDVFDATVRRRVQLGDVYLFDPMRTIPDPLPKGVTRCGWSPLHSARTVSGAMEAANLLMEAAPSEGVTNANYWSRKGEALLWPMLFAAAIANRTMADVVRWLAVQDGSKEHKPAAEGSPKESGVDPKMARGEMRALLVEATKDPDDRIAIQATHALAQFDGFWHLDPRTRSDIYSTSQTLVQPWEDPYVSFASTSDAGPVVDLRALLSGRNTLYVVQPLKSTQRFSVVFGGVLGALLKDQAYDEKGKPKKESGVNVEFDADLSEQFIAFAFDPTMRNRYRFSIEERSLVGEHVVYRIGFAPRSALDPFPTGRVWVDTNDFVILREEFWYRDRSPAPLFIERIENCVLERELVDGRYWVLKRLLARATFSDTIRFLGKVSGEKVPKDCDFAFQQTDWIINGGVPDSLFIPGPKK